MDILERVQKRAMKMVKGLEHLTCKERLKDLRVISLGKKRLEGISVHINI